MCPTLGFSASGTQSFDGIPQEEIHDAPVHARVSTTDQDTELQFRELKAAGCERIYRGHSSSGASTSCPELYKMLDTLSRGNEVEVWKLDRLGRNMGDLLELLDSFYADTTKFRRCATALPPVLEVGKGDVGVVEEVVGVDELTDGGGACVGPV
ncbi:MAG: recombinase family protein [Specibacter sp.]